MKSLQDNPLHTNYNVSISDFQGPLDLLLRLIEKEELDITRISLAKVTDQFIEYIQEPGNISVDQLSYFVVVGSRLIQLKSEVLLPGGTTSHTEDGESDEDLIQQLLIYKRFKEISGFLYELEQNGQKSYLRIAPPPAVELDFDMGELKLELLTQYATIALTNAGSKPEPKVTLTRTKITIRKKIETIADYLAKFHRGTFRNFLSDKPSRGEIVAAFLALLELIKRDLLHASQKSIFSEIEVESEKEWNQYEEFEIEFSE